MPDELATFEASAWRDGADGWARARWRWGKAHGWPVDPIDMLREVRDTKRRLSVEAGLRHRWS